MKKHKRSYIEPSFFVFLVLSALLWFAGRLDKRYTTELTLPVHIENDYTAVPVAISPASVTLSMRVEGTGSYIIAYKVGTGHRISIPMSRLATAPGVQYTTGDNGATRLNIVSPTLGDMISGAAKDIRVLQVLDTAAIVTITPLKK